MNAALLRGRVLLRKVKWTCEETPESLRQARVEAGIRFLKKLHRHNLGDLGHRLVLEPVMRQDGRYQESFRLDLSDTFSPEWAEALKNRLKNS